MERIITIAALLAVLLTPLAFAACGDFGSCSGCKTCGSCTNTPRCGWCKATNQCLSGTEAGPDVADACPEEQWVYYSIQCMAPTPTPTPTPVSCSAYTSCEECTDTLDCIWCMSNGGCFPLGAGEEVCPGNEWAIISGDCAAPTITPTPEQTTTPTITPAATPEQTPEHEETTPTPESGETPTPVQTPSQGQTSTTCCPVAGLAVLLLGIAWLNKN